MCIKFVLWLTTLACFMACTGCNTFDRPSWMSNPFRRDDDSADPLYAETKAAKVDQIRALAVDADRLSPAEQTQVSGSLAKRLQDEQDPVLKLELVRSLQAFSTPSAIEGIRSSLTDSRPRIRIAACEALAKMRTPQAMDLLAATLHADSNLDVRVAATRGLSSFRSQRTMQALANAIEDPNPALQYTAVQSMRKIHDQDLGDNVQAWQQLAKTYQRTDEGAEASSGDAIQLAAKASDEYSY